MDVTEWKNKMDVKCIEYTEVKVAMQVSFLPANVRLLIQDSYPKATAFFIQGTEHVLFYLFVLLHLSFYQACSEYWILFFILFPSYLPANHGHAILHNCLFSLEADQI